VQNLVIGERPELNMTANMNTFLKIAVVCAVQLFCVSVRADIFPTNVTRVVFLGDSITYGGFYVRDLIAYQRTHSPKRQIEFINIGLPSETTCGLSEPGHAGGKFPRPDLHERLARALSKTKPDLVLACYGMNDGIFLPLDPERFAAFQKGMSRFHETVEKSGAQIIHITPPIFDETKGGHAGYAAVLDRYSEWLVGQRTHGWKIIDLHGPMKEKLVDERKTDSSFAFGRDGVHPDEVSHWLMAKIILKNLGAADIETYTNAAQLLSTSARQQQLLDLIQRQMVVLRDAWLTDIGHKRPLAPGLPLPKAQAKAEELEKEIQMTLTVDQ
jgi:lysophospholipase L1-like esterase